MNEEFNMGCFGVLAFIILCTFCMVGLDYTTEKAQCNSKANALGYSHDYGYLQGCVLIKPDGKKVLLEQLRDFDR